MRLFINVTCLLLVTLTALILPLTAHSALIDQPMTGPTAPGWVLGGTPTSANLTGNGITDPVGDGWLRLTNNAGNQAGYAYFDTSFNLSQGALIQFDYATWGGTGADGYTVFLFDASAPVFNIGAAGGSLGYAQKSTPTPGISGGYVGIGVDEFGNFSNPTEGRYLGPGSRPNTVTVRGPVSSAAPPIGGTQGTQSYPWVATSASISSLWANQATRPATTGSDHRRVMMRISPAPNPFIDVWIQFGFNQPMTSMIAGATIGAAPPANLKIGYAASTGGSTNYHEIRNLTVEPIGTSTSINLGVSKIASVNSMTVGSPITYTVTVRNYGPNNITANGVGIIDTVPAQITGVTWNCTPTGTASCGAPSGSDNNLNSTANLPYNTAVTYTINGTLTSSPGSNLVNTASITTPAGITDYRSSDDSATLSIPVITSFDFGITKTSSNSRYLIGDTINYTVVAQNKGPANGTAYNVSVIDSVPTELTGVTWTCSPSPGATCVNASGSGNTINAASHLPLNGTATYSISGTLSSLPASGSLSNTASVVAPPGYTDPTPANNTATTAIPAGGSIPGTGYKPLYIYETPIQMTRIQNTQINPVTIATSGGIQTWSLNPVLQLPSILSPTINTNVPVFLVLRRLNNNGDRSITVNLQCSSGGTTLTRTQTVALTNTRTLFTFDLPLGAPLTCAAGNAWNLRIVNNSTEDIRLYPYDAGRSSYVNLPTTTVININNSDISFHGVAYPGVSALTSVTPGQTVYIRASVTDPFGSYDITSAELTLRNPSGTVMTPTPVAMTAKTLDTPLTATKIFEYAYLVPLAGPRGNWTSTVLAKEGAEVPGVSDSAQATMPVLADPNLTVLKTAFGVTSGATAKPAQEVPYIITVTNTGAGKAWNTSVTDALSPYSAFKLNSLVFTDGSTFSGLSMTGSTISYSYDNAATWTTTPPADLGGGYNGTVTNWKIVFDPALLMNSNNAFFTIAFKVMVK